MPSAGIAMNGRKAVPQDQLVLEIGPKAGVREFTTREIQTAQEDWVNDELSNMRDARWNAVVVCCVIKPPARRAQVAASCSVDGYVS